MHNNDLPQEIHRKPRFRTGVIVINFVIPIYALTYEFLLTMAIITDSESTKYLKVNRPVLYYIYYFGNVACLLDLVVSSLFLTTVMYYSKKRNFMLSATSVWATWNCIRLVFEVVKFIENLPRGYSSSWYLVFAIVNVIYSAVEILLRMVSIPVVILHYKWMSFVDMGANIEDVGEIPLVDNEDHILHDHEMFENRPQRRESSFTLRTVLIAANSIPLLATILIFLPLYIVWLALGYPAIWLSMTRPILITRITVDLFEILLAFSILVFLWANFKKVFRPMAVLWIILHIVRVILQFACCIWMSQLTTTALVSTKWHIIRVVREYLILILWIICIIFVTVATYRDGSANHNIPSQPPSSALNIETTDEQDDVHVY